MTPEGKVKKDIDVLLKAWLAYYHKPVQNGMGKPQLDYTGCHQGLAFYIEAKRPGGEPTERQIRTMRAQNDARASIFLIDGTESPDFTELNQWLAQPRTNFLSTAVLRVISTR